MTDIPALRPSDVIAMLRRAGYVIDRQTGSHVFLYKEGKPPAVVPRHNRDIKKGTLHNIIKGAEMTVEEFLKQR